MLTSEQISMAATAVLAGAPTGAALAYAGLTHEALEHPSLRTAIAEARLRLEEDLIRQVHRST